MNFKLPVPPAVKSRACRHRIVAATTLLLAGWLLFRIVQLSMASSHPVDAVLVLGGSPIRERWAAKLTRDNPSRRVLISSGSEDPCIWLIFDKARAPKTNVWMEHCSHNTFENLAFAAPILKSWGVHKVLLLTDMPQTTKALPMAKMILGASGIAVQLQNVPNSAGLPLHHPVWLDITAAMLWVPASQFISPHCQQLTRLSEVNMQYWYQKGFHCQQQAEVDDYHPRSAF